jgi:heptosyltransferase-2
MGTDSFEGLKTDCRHFRYERPCAPHKKKGVVCATCVADYDPVRTHVLVVKLAATGDVLRTTALLPAIHAAWPRARVTWLTAPSARALFSGNPLVDEVLVSNDPITTARLSVQEFDVVLCPDAEPATAALAASARGRERRGYTLDARGRVVPLSPAAERWFRMGIDDGAKRRNRATYQSLVAEALGLAPGEVKEPILVPDAAASARAQGFRARLGFSGRLIGLNTGAGGRWAYKQWTLPHQLAFVRLAHEAGMGVLLLGGPEEGARHEELQRGSPGRAVFDGGTGNSFAEFAALVDLCDAVVTGDTFALHVACARKKPAIVLFGPTSAAEIEIYGRGAKLVPPGLDCLCCYLPICDKKPYCQELITPEAVLEAVERAMGSARG